MLIRLDHLNTTLQAKSFACLNDAGRPSLYSGFMAKPAYDWFLKDWLKTLGKKQADVVRDLDWNKAKISLTASGKQPYTRDDVNELAIYLNLKPHELLMHPDDAMALRRLRADMIRLAAEEKPAPGASEEKKVSTG